MNALSWRPGRPTLACVQAHLQSETHGDTTRAVACFDVDDRGSFGRAYATVAPSVPGGVRWAVRIFGRRSDGSLAEVETTPPRAAHFRPVDLTSGEARPWQDVPTGEARAVLDALAASPGGTLSEECLVWSITVQRCVDHGWIARIEGPDARYVLTDTGRAALTMGSEVLS